jgi:molybdopterin-guanine dinucleotide biosynthesis protein A
MKNSKKYSNFSCAILAGGKNSRFGGMDKAFIEIEGKPIIEKLVSILELNFDDVLIISNQKEKYSSFKNISVFEDFYKEIGPLAGIHSAIKNCKNEFCVILACDMPNISTEAIEFFVSEFQNSDVLIPTLNGLKEPLFAIYSKKILENLEHFIECENSRKIRAFLQTQKVQFVEIPEKFRIDFMNINSPNDLK